MLGLTILLVVILMAVIGPMLIVNDPWAMLGQPFAKPFTIDGLPLGSDTMGRDLMAGLVHGARVSLVIALISTTVALLIGVTLGALAGYHGGWVDSTIMRFTDLFHAVPGFALAVVMVAIFQPSIYSIITAIAAVTWAPVARLVRSEFLSLRQRRN